MINEDDVNRVFELPSDNFEDPPTQDEITQFFQFIQYQGEISSSGMQKKFLVPEWEYFFDTLAKAFSPTTKNNFTNITNILQLIRISIVTPAVNKKLFTRLSDTEKFNHIHVVTTDFMDQCFADYHVAFPPADEEDDVMHQINQAMVAADVQQHQNPPADDDIEPFEDPFKPNTTPTQSINKTQTQSKHIPQIQTLIQDLPQHLNH